MCRGGGINDGKFINNGKAQFPIDVYLDFFSSPLDYARHFYICTMIRDCCDDRARDWRSHCDSSLSPALKIKLFNRFIFFYKTIENPSNRNDSHLHQKKKDFSLKHLRRFFLNILRAGLIVTICSFFLQVWEREKKRKSFEDAYHLSAVEKEKKCRVKYLF